jgi:hypothetical protein
MSSFLRPVLFFLLVAAAFSSARGDASTGRQDLGLGWEEGQLTVTYVAEPNLSTELQESSNLLEWGPAHILAEKVSENADGTRLIKAVVSSAGPGMFFQLRRAPAKEIAIAWDPVIDPAVAGYAVRLRRRGDIGFRRINTGPATTTTLVLPQDGGLYAFDVVCYTAEGVESEPSNAITIVVEDKACD